MMQQRNIPTDTAHIAVWDEKYEAYTEDEYFDYYRKRHAHWKMYGLSLPDSVLKKIYYKNALRILPSIDKNLFE